LYAQPLGTSYYGKRYPIQNTASALVSYLTSVQTSSLGVIPIAVLVTINNGVLLKKAKSFEFEFIGEFNPGDIVVIDSKRMIVTLNGENALHLVGKDEFPEIMPEGNEFLYSDISGTRVVRIRVKWQDRWL